MKHFLLIFLFCFQACWGDDYIAVQKRDVTYNFCKMNISWLDYFISCEFKGWEEDTFDTFDLVQNQDGVAIDLGAWIGTTAIYLCKNFKYVVAVEADKDSLKYLKKNLTASNCSNVIICEKAISHNGLPAIFGPRVSSVDELNRSTSCSKELQDATDSLLNYIVPTIKLEDLITECVSKNPDCNGKVTFIKCDIEGGEETILKDVLTYAAVNKCTVWMSFHYEWWKNKNIESYESLFSKFYCNPKEISKSINYNPYASILFIPK